MWRRTHRRLQPEEKGHVSLSIASLRPCDRSVIAAKLAVMAHRGPAGNSRIATNAVRIGAGRWERPSPSEAWRRKLAARRFEEISVLPFEHEGGIALARKPTRGRR